MYVEPTFVNCVPRYVLCIVGTILLLLLYIYMGNNSGKKGKSITSTIHSRSIAYYNDMT